MLLLQRCFKFGRGVGNYALDLIMTDVLKSRGADPVGAGAPAENGIEITPEMIEAGEAVIWHELCGSLTHPSFCSGVLAKRVFEEMLRAAPSAYKYVKL